MSELVITVGIVATVVQTGILGFIIGRRTVHAEVGRVLAEVVSAVETLILTVEGDENDA